MSTYRTRWLDDAGFAVAERRRTKLMFGFWPTYVWETVAHFPTRGEALRWIIDHTD